MPSKNGCAAEALDAKHSTVCPLKPELDVAAAVALLVAEVPALAVPDALAALLDEREPPESAEVPELAVERPVAAPPPVADPPPVEPSVVVLPPALVVLLAMPGPVVDPVVTLSSVAPRPWPPALAAPVDAAPLPAPVPAVVLAGLAPDAAPLTASAVASPVPLPVVLDKVWPAVTAAESAAVVAVVDAVSVGKVTLPVPTWPPPDEPGTGPAAAPAAPLAASCASAGTATHNRIAVVTEIALITGQHASARRVPRLGCGIRPLLRSRGTKPAG